MVNPVLPQVLAELRAHPEGVSEYGLMKILDRQQLFEEQNEAGPGLLPLYRKHFLIMNALYDLQDILWQEEHRVLDISPMHIALHERQADNADEEPDWYPLLSEYYLDWDVYRETTAEDVDRMMAALKEQSSLPH
ncbi:DNA-J related domain-containing protein [Marinobacterium sp. YM272]|uniref:DNA-J related domain-containing protein n=1 Tax=Marinobacterium sp. YM272 TaxID=3421654 RepID=UPI003D7F5117